MKRIEQIKDYREKNEQELREAISNSERELMNLRFKAASSQLQNSAQMKSIRRTIARAKTVLAEQVLLKEV
jgi:large subunit ribosomal protein L29